MYSRFRYPQEDKFNQNLEECLRYSTVVGMMFYGNSHTTDPDNWLGKFRNHDYRILPVILYAIKELCFERCNSDRERPSINKQREIPYLELLFLILLYNNSKKSEGSQIVRSC